MAVNVWPVNAVTGAPSYDGRELRQVGAALLASAPTARPLGARSGVRPGTLVDTVTATPTVWTVKPHAGVLDLQTSATAGAYQYAIDANVTGAVTAANATNPREDIVYVKLDDPAEGDGSSVPAVTPLYLAGTAAAVPAVPATPARSMVLAIISVPTSGGGSPTVQWTAPYLDQGTIPVRTSTERDAITWATAENPVTVFRLDLGIEETNYGSGWSGSSIGPWITYTASLAGTFSVGTLGSPVAETVWRREGDLIRVRYRFVFGTDGTTTFASGATFTLPVNAATADIYRSGTGLISRAPTSHLSIARIESATTVRITLGTTPLVNITSTTPWGGVWAAGDAMAGELTYRAA